MKLFWWVLLLWLTGCGLWRPEMVWTKPDASPRAFAQDRYRCSQESRVPQTNVFTGEVFIDEDSSLWRQCMEARGWTLIPKPR